MERKELKQFLKTRRIIRHKAFDGIKNCTLIIPSILKPFKKEEFKLKKCANVSWHKCEYWEIVLIFDQSWYDC